MTPPTEARARLELTEADLALALDAVELWGDIARHSAPEMADQAAAADDLAARLRAASPEPVSPAPAAVEARRMLARALVARLD